MKRFAFILSLLVCALVAQMAAAQSFQSLGGQTSNLLVSTDPALPGPNQFVNVAVQSYATDLDRADISWFVNNKLQKEAVGVKTFLFKTGAVGSVTNILILVKTAGGEALQQVLNIYPAALDLIWEAQSYTPPFYRGKALYTYEGTVKVVAIPDIVTETGAAIDPKTLVYSWKVDGDPVVKLSGYGKNFMFFNGAIPLSPATIEVEAASIDKKYAATGKVTIAPQAPQVLFYEDNPIYGVLYNKTLGGNTALQNQEIKLVGIPYFAGTQNRDGGGLSYEWRLNNQVVGGFGPKSSLAFKQPGGVSGTALVSLQVSNPDKMFQFANNSVSLIFGQTPAAAQFPTQ